VTAANGHSFEMGWTCFFYSADTKQI